MTKIYRKKITVVLSLVLPVIVLFAISNCFTTHVFHEDYKYKMNLMTEIAANIGIDGEIVATTSHSADSISLILDSGECFVGDLEPIEYLAAYEQNEKLKYDWELVMRYAPKTIYYAHANEKHCN